VRAYAARHGGCDGAAAPPALGCFGHPAACGAYHATSASHASHRVLSLRWERSCGAAELRGVLQVLPTQAGAALLTAHLATGALGVSTRGWAHLEGGLAAEFQLITFDVVAMPATAGAALLPLARALPPSATLLYEE
jgi:hypothetical protein